MDDSKPKVIMACYTDPITKRTPPPTDPIPDSRGGLVALVLVSYADGTKANRWMTGKIDGLKGGYDFQPCCPTDVYPEDAKRLLAGFAGRLFARADSPERKAALAGAAPKVRW